jgi:hypothetical protein
LSRALPSSFVLGSSTDIIFWTLLGFGGLMLLFILYCCLCRRQYPNYYSQGFGGISGAYGAPGIALPGQSGFK